MYRVDAVAGSGINASNPCSFPVRVSILRQVLHAGCSLFVDLMSPLVLYAGKCSISLWKSKF